jgi:hypothetical protein
MTAPQQALSAVRDTARARTTEAMTRIAAIDRVPVGAVDEMLAAIASHGRITLNFHPDRLLADGSTVIAAMARDGAYRSQFETGISNGGRTAYPGGDRDRWERRMFHGAYQAAGVDPADRPKYGALNLADHADGASPRFGSCHVRLRPEVNARATFSAGDSATEPGDLGTIDAFAPVLAGLLESDPGALALLRALPVDSAGRLGRVLDGYVEAQVHGRLDLARDAEAIVADPSFLGTAVGDDLAATTGRWGIALEWHAGFRLAPDRIPGAFRGDHIPPFAASIADLYQQTTLDPALLGRAAADPAAWSHLGSPDELLQHVKYVWHALVAYH